jgi:Xaa-Pro aminopeptidase
VSFDFAGRLVRLQDLMATRGVDLTLVSVGADLLYLTGYDTHPSERLTALVVRTHGLPTLFVPDLEAPKVQADGVDLVSWSETTDPITLIADAGPLPRRVAIGDHLWSVFLLRFQEIWASALWEPASGLVGDLRLVKDEAEVDALRAAGAAVDRAMKRIPDEVRFSGRTEVEVQRDLVSMTLEEGHQVSEFCIVASGPNGASPHHAVGDRVIEMGDLVVCDFGGRWDGYFSDSTRTFSVGEPGPEQLEVHSAVLAAQEAARQAARPGVACEEVDRAARAVISDAGYGDFFIHRTGHGIGLEVHEHPYMVEGNRAVLEAGMAFSIEPGIYLPGRFGVRIEDIVVCRPDGIETLNLADRRLVEVA